MNTMKYTTLLITILMVTSLVKTEDQTNVIGLKDLADTLNAFRADPKKYAGKIQARILDNLDTDNKLPETGYRFREGRAVVQEAIDFLNSVDAVAPLELDHGMIRSAWEHSQYQTTLPGYKKTSKGPDGADPARKYRWERFLLYNNYESENRRENKLREIILNADDQKWDCSELLVMRMIIDDRRQKRRKRSIIFDPKLTKFGIGIAPYTKTKKNGKQKNMDRITILFATNAVCTNCDFTDDVDDQICWTNFSAGDKTCDPENVEDETVAEDEDEDEDDN